MEGGGLLLSNAAKTCLSLIAAARESDSEDVVGFRASVGSRVAWNRLEVAHASGLILNTVEDVSGGFHGLATGSAVGHGLGVGEEGSLVSLPVLLLNEIVSLCGVNSEESVG